ncbi:MAG: (2Fe-2S)-binding protein [Fimbriimonadaceae bacterium]|nr:(2Fe-2S)-binding protein [Fimbriimonadaceae bacterium]QYK59463.1 MAG: (2Fe-2S)-binding protein [Fimbriimonadaceae bacterium]
MGSYTIKVQGFGEFEAQEGTKLVKAIEDNGVDVSHRCGGQARCTTCRVKFFSDEPPMGATEKDCLEEDGVLGEFRLSCQVRVDRDMEVAVLMRASDQGWEPGPEVEP